LLEEADLMYAKVLDLTQSAEIAEDHRDNHPFNPGGGKGINLVGRMQTTQNKRRDTTRTLTE